MNGALKIAITSAFLMLQLWNPALSFTVPEQPKRFTVETRDLSEAWSFQGTSLRHVTKISVTFLDSQQLQKSRFEDYLYDDSTPLSCRRHLPFPIAPDENVDIDISIDPAASMQARQAAANVAARIYLECVAKRVQMYTIWVDGGSRCAVIEELNRLGFVREVPQVNAIVPTLRIATRDCKSLDSLSSLYFDSRKMLGRPYVIR